MQDGSEIILAMVEDVQPRNCISSTMDTRNIPNSTVDEEKLHQQLKVCPCLPVRKVATSVMLLR